MHQAKGTFDGEPSSVPAARHFVSEAMQAGDAGNDSWVAAQVVSELATNAVVHAATAFVVEIRIDEALVRISVTDRRPFAIAAQRNFGQDSTTGRGLRLVAMLSTSWGVDTTDTTKTVWCEMMRTTVENAGRAPASTTRLIPKTGENQGPAPRSSPQLRGRLSSSVA